MWVITIALVVAFLFLCLGTAGAGTIYAVDGLFSRSFDQPVLASFSGRMEFPNETIEEGLLTIQATNEPDIVREVPFQLTLNLPGNALMPWDTRQFVGEWNEEPVIMFAVDYDMEAGLILDSDAMEDGGGWDVWAVSFPDWPAGNFTEMTPIAVNEPGALALLAIGAVVLVGICRSNADR
jgi:hypothetical protein